ncbi:Potassium efflux system KefA protein / Small-conductance mechanosensitive channel [hydrothermal vent metagenome]|uniref:Potassium efflux system KefA protein / Small-conductance mechanosensitive channel n=1 Tax=hydrothermal vent metagenome TaxID=652676 RepID=A0A3B0T0M5_9ZZZZ
MITLLRTLLLTFSLLLAPTVIMLPTGQAHAQQPVSGPDYATWEKTALRAENAIEAGRASTQALEGLRIELRKWREQFNTEKNANAKTIATVQAQLDALGPVPEDGNEAEDVAQRRDQLNQQLKRLSGPVKIADLAYSRANGLISGIDQIIRERQTKALLELGPSPLNPVHWRNGMSALYGSASTIRSEISAAWKNPAQRDEFKAQLPVMIVLALLGFVLVVRGRYWSEILARRLQKGRESAAWWVITFIVSLGELLLPFAGMVALVIAVYATGLVGLRGDLLLPKLLPAVFIFLLARWLSTRIFPRNKLRALPLQLNSVQRRAGRLYGGCLGLVIAVFYLLSQMAELGDWPDAARNAVLFPVLIVAGFLLSRMARLLLIHSRAGGDDSGEETFRDKIFRLLSRAMLMLAVAAPALAAIGYFRAAQSLMLPSLLSLLLLGVLLVLQRLVSEVYTLLSGNKDDAADSLLPVLAGMLIMLISLPLFALIWGARVADLTELWIRFTEGVYIGGTQVSPQVFLSFAIVFMIGYMITRLLQGVLKNTVLPKTKMDAGGRNAIVSGVGYLGIFLAALIAITSAGIDLSSLAIVAGALSVGIGFGLQNIVSNFVSGIILLVERPISEGDWIEVGGQHGVVRDISVRSTRIETFDRSDVIVPNSDLISGTVTNYTRGNTIGRVKVQVGVAYGTDTRRVEKILLEIAQTHPMVLANPTPSIVFQQFGASSLDFEIRAILRDVNSVLSVQSDMNHEIARRFAEEDIEIPFEQRDIWIRNPEAMSGAEKLGMSKTKPTALQPGQKDSEDNDAGDGE